MTPYEEGLAAARAYLNDPCAEAGVNPYDPDSLSYDDWLDGYLEAFEE